MKQDDFEERKNQGQKVVFETFGRALRWLKTYKRGFFFGPGLPRGFGTLSMASCELVRFIPGFGPGMPFRFTGFGGGASRLLLLAAACGTGVALESDG